MGVERMRVVRVEASILPVCWNTLPYANWSEQGNPEYKACFMQHREKYMKFWMSAWMITALFFIACSFEKNARAEVVLTDNQTWEQDRDIQGNLIIPDGITLTISKGVRVRLQSEPGSEAPPAILVNGHLELEGEEDSPVILTAAPGQKREGWAGIIIDDGNAWFRAARIQDAHTAVYVRRGWVKLKKSIVQGNRCGVVILGDRCGIKIEMSTITGNEYGVITDRDAVVSFPGSIISDNRVEDRSTVSEKLPLPESCALPMQSGDVNKN